MRMLRIGLTVLAATLALMTSVAPLQYPARAAADPVTIQPPPVIPVPPGLDPFDTADAAVLAQAQPGQILKARQIRPAFEGFLRMNLDAWQLLYRSNDSFQQPIAVVTTIFKAHGDSTTGPRKLLSYQIAEDSAARYCSPSYVLQAGGLPIDFANAAEPLIPLAAGISQGWTVAVPDYEGPKSSYAASRIEAQATLDGIRAVENFAPAQVNGAATPAAMWGYSGGSVPTAFAAEIKDKYAPELNVVGAASGGIASADYVGVIKHNNGGFYAGLITGAFVGIGNEYPAVATALQQNGGLLGNLVLLTKKVLCHVQGVSILPGLNYLSLFEGNALNYPAVKAALADITLGQRTPTVPEFLYNAVNDEIVPIAGVDRLVNKYCTENAPSIVYTRELLAAHISGVFTSMPAAYNWLRDRLNGLPPASGCTTINDNTEITDPKFEQALKQLLPSAAEILAGYAVGAANVW